MATEAESSPKRLKLSPKKLCVICSCSHMDCSDTHNIFMVDLNGGGTDEYVKTAASVRLQGFDSSLLFCVSGSDLYMIDGSGERLVYKYNLDGVGGGDALPLKSEIVEEDSRLAVSKMPNRKGLAATAIPTPDGKILVLSNVIYFYDPDPDAAVTEKHGAELYDPKNDVWTQLPELFIRHTINCNDSHDVGFEILDDSGSWTKFARISPKCRGRSPDGHFFYIRSYTFISESILLVHIKSEFFEGVGHLLSFNIGKGWKLYDGGPFRKRDTAKFEGGLVTVKNRLMLDAYGGIDLTSEGGPAVNVKFPRSVLGGKLEEKTRDIVLTDYVEDKECCFAIAAADPFFQWGKGASSHLVVDEFRYELTQGGGICTPKIDKSFKFLISEMTDIFFIEGAFMLPQISPFPFKKQAEVGAVKIKQKRNGISLRALTKGKLTIRPALILMASTFILLLWKLSVFDKLYAINAFTSHL